MENNLEKLVETGRLVTKLANHAKDNKSFKEKLIAEPHSTIDDYIGRKGVFSSKTKIVVNEPNSDEVYLNIPRKVDLEDIELSDIELETISGGSDLITGIVIGIIAIGAGYGASKIF